MSDQSTIEAATKRLTQALDALEAAAERRLEADRAGGQLASRLHAADTDRSKLAAALDDQSARARLLEATNRDVARRLDAAIDSIRSVIAAQDR